VITVAIPTIPTRPDLLARAVRSVAVQTLPAAHVSIAVDHAREGAAPTRNRAWQAARTEWVAFLDDDDELLPMHLARCYETAITEDADLVYPWFEVIGGTDPFPTHFGKPWTPGEPRQTTIACLWRRAALEKVGGFPEPGESGVDAEGNRVGEDFLAVMRLDEMGGKIVHLPERTWLWHHHLENTSGLPGRW
jgi:glycosyltransferase involved in cell wall biosynthesis